MIEYRLAGFLYHVTVLSSLNDFTPIKVFNELIIMQQNFINIPN